MMRYQFPEDDYTPAPRFGDEYETRRHQGYAWASELTAVVCGLGRDLGDHVDCALAAMTAIGGLFAEYRICIYENDSKDDTDTRLKAFADDNPHARVCSEQLNRTKWPSIRHTQRGREMAEYYRRCQEMAHDAFPEMPDIVVVLDMDLAGWSIDGIASTLGVFEPWSMMGANGLKSHHGRLIQYDAWAWRDVDNPHPLPATLVNHRAYDRGHPPVPVLSCFGGLGIYRGEAYFAGQYGGEDCPHVPFHRSLHAAGYPHLFCNPGMITTYV